MKFLNKKLLINWNLIFNLFYKGFYFFIFNFLNTILPFVLLIIASFIPTIGTFIVGGIGQVISFQIIFLQLSLSLAISSILLIRKKTKNKNFQNASPNNLGLMAFYLSFAFGLILMVFFMVTAYLYTFFLNSSQNSTIHEIQLFSTNFVLSFSPVIFLTSINTMTSLYIFYKKGTLFIFLVEIFNFLIIILFCSIFSLLTTLNVFGISLGVILGLLFSNSFNIFYIFFYKKYIKFEKIKIKSQFLEILKMIWIYGFVGMWTSILKSIIIIAIGISFLRSSPESFSSFYFAKIIWYNLLYFLPFFNNSLLNAINFINSTKEKEEILSRENLNAISFLTLVTLFINIFLIIICFFAINPLINTYIQNQNFANFKLTTENINTFIFLPNSIAYVFTFIYASFNGFGQYLSKVQTFFEKPKQIIFGKKQIFTKIAFNSLIIIFIIIFGILLEPSNSLIGGLSAFSFPLSLISIVFIIFGILNYSKLFKQFKNNKKEE